MSKADIEFYKTEQVIEVASQLAKQDGFSLSNVSTTARRIYFHAAVEKLWQDLQ